MAIFDCYGELEINITPKEFVNGCSDVELIRLNELIKDKFEDEFKDVEIVEMEKPRSFGHKKFNDALRALQSVSWRSLTQDDSDIIEEIANKYK